MNLQIVVYGKNMSISNIKIGDIYKSFDGFYFIVTGFKTWSETTLGRIAYIEYINATNRKDQRTIEHIANHCELVSRANI